jgi:hypothetical protein
MISSIWGENINSFIKIANQEQVRMLMVGGGAVNFHGYQRHSADVDFWIETTSENLAKLISTFKKLGYNIEEFPESVKKQEQNISLKFSPADFELELITKFSTHLSFEEAFQNAEQIIIENESVLKWRVLSLHDLINSKIRANRPKDLLDVQQLKKINDIQ